MQGARRDAVRAGPPPRLLAAGNAAARRLWQLEIIIILWRLFRVTVKMALNRLRVTVDIGGGR